MPGGETLNLVDELHDEQVVHRGMRHPQLTELCPGEHQRVRRLDCDGRGMPVLGLVDQRLLAEPLAGDQQRRRDHVAAG